MSTDPNQLRAELTSAATTIDAGAPGETLARVESIGRRRKRRRNTVLGVAAAGALVASGAVVANLVGSDGEPDRIVSPVATDPADDAETDGAADEPAAATTLVPAPPTTAIPTGQSTGTVIDVGATRVLVDQLLPWKDGFLAISTAPPPVPLPAELPDEIAAQFPDEVIAFFEEQGGLPPTVDEAIDMLEEAGLFDVVAEVVTADPEVYDAIYGEPQPPVTPARFTRDGESWEAIDLTLPDAGSLVRIVSTGERLIAATQTYSTGAEPVRPPTAGAITVSWTEDLENWSSFAPDVAGVDELPGFITAQAFVSDVVANDRGWLVVVDTFNELDVEALLPPDAEFNPGANGWGWSSTDDGIVVEIGSETGQPAEYPFTWAELGVDGLEDIDGPSTPTVWASAWDGVPVQAAIESWGRPVAYDGGFLVDGPDTDLMHSLDGVTWSGVPRPPGDGWSQLWIPTSDGVVAVVGENGPPTVSRLAGDTLTWEPIDVGALPANVYQWSEATGPAVVYAVEESVPSTAGPATEGGDFRVEFTVPYEGYELDVLITEDIQSYELRDVATGDVVASESIQGDLDSDLPWEHLTENGDLSITITSPETGDEVVTIPVEALEAARPDGDSSTATSSYAEAPAEEVGEGVEYERPTLGLLATDGERWINEPLDLGDGNDFLSPAVATNGEIVLVSVGDGTFLRWEF